MEQNITFREAGEKVSCHNCQHRTWFGGLCKAYDRDEIQWGKVRGSSQRGAFVQVDGAFIKLQDTFFGPNGMRPPCKLANTSSACDRHTKQNVARYVCEAPQRIFSFALLRPQL